MAAVLTNEYKYSFRYVANEGNSSTTKTISGLNIRPSSGGSGDELGPYVSNLITYMYNMVNGLTTSTVGNVRWVSERGVSL